MNDILNKSEMNILLAIYEHIFVDENNTNMNLSECPNDLSEAIDTFKNTILTPDNMKHVTDLYNQWLTRDPDSDMENPLS